jgi:hypothetical protein
MKSKNYGTEYFPQPLVVEIKFAENGGTSNKYFDWYSEDALLDVRLFFFYIFVYFSF